MTTDFAAQARVREKLESVGDIRPTAIAEILDLFIAGKMIKARLDTDLKELRERRPEMFFNAGTDALAIDAFVNGNLTARGVLSKQMTTAELAAALSITRLEIYDANRSGALPIYKRGARRRTTTP